MTLNSRDIPRAEGFKVCFCGHCPNAHLVMYDVQHRPICQAVVSAGQADDIAAAIRKRDPNFREIGS